MQKKFLFCKMFIVFIVWKSLAIAKYISSMN